MKQQTKGIISIILIIAGTVLFIATARWSCAAIRDITNALTTPQAILIAAVILAVTIRTKKGK